MKRMAKKLPFEVVLKKLLPVCLYNPRRCKGSRDKVCRSGFHAFTAAQPSSKHPLIGISNPLCKLPLGLYRSGLHRTREAGRRGLPLCDPIASLGDLVFAVAPPTLAF